MLQFDEAPLIRYNARRIKSGMNSTFFPLLYVQLEGASCVADEASHPCISRWNGISRHFDRGGRQQRRRGGFQHLHHRLPGNSHRPILLPADRHADLSAYRQHRRATPRMWNRVRCSPAAWSSATCPCGDQFPQHAILPEYLKANNVVAIAGIDTRRLTRILRTKGAQNGCIATGDDVEAALDRGARVCRTGGYGSGQGGDLRQTLRVERSACGNWARAIATVPNRNSMSSPTTSA